MKFVDVIELCGMLDYTIITSTPPNQGAVVIVDPFSTGGKNLIS